jgi:glycosyltransferase involved in cell wall biosynthesis
MQPHEPRLSVILVVKNEAAKIRRCLQSLAWADEIIVLDQSSEDATVAICREFTPHVFTVTDKGFCEPDRAAAAAKASHDWVFYVDADEAVTDELSREIRAVCSGSPQRNGYFLSRKTIFLGRWIRGSGWYPGYVLRLFNKKHVSFPARIHEDITVNGSSGCLKNPLIHYTCEDLAEYIDKVNRYTTISARQAFESGVRIRRSNFVQRVLLLPAAYAVQRFFFMAGFRDGSRGVLIALLTFHTVMVTQCKIMEMQKSDERR